MASADEKPLCIGSNTNRKRTPTLHIQHGISVKRAILAIVTSSVYKKVVIFHATKTTCKLCDDTFQIKGAVVTPIKYAMNHNLKLNKRNYQQNHLSFVTYTAFLYISNKNPDWAHTIDKSTTNGMPFCSCKNFRPHNQLHFSHPCRFSGILLSILNPILIILHSKF